MTEANISREPWALWKIGIVAAVVSAVANLVLMLVTRSSIAVPEGFGPFGVIPIILWSDIGAFGAIGVYALIRKMSKSPNRNFTIAAVIVLVLSFIPDLALVYVTEGPLGGATTGAIIVLMIMHVISFFIVVPMLRSLANESV